MNQPPINSEITSINPQPLISVITVVFNGAEYIEQTIRSVLNQTYQNIEYIVIDGGSQDGTIDIIKKYSDRIGTWISEPDKGIYDAINKGIDRCNGVLISTLNSDDYYSNDDVVQRIVDRYDETIGIYYGDVKIVERDTGSASYTRYANLSKIRYGMYLNHPATFIRAELYKRFGTYSMQYKIAADYDMLLQLFLEKCRFSYIKDEMVSMRDGGVSIEQGLLAKSEVLQVRKQRLPPVVYFYTRFIQYLSSFSRWAIGR